MILIDNIAFLKKYNLNLLKTVQVLENECADPAVELVAARSGDPTLKISRLEMSPFHLHSQYNPRNEAENVIQPFEEASNNYEYVLFYGVGLGYHVEAYKKRFPNSKVILYEPDRSIFYKLLCSRTLNELKISHPDELMFQFSEQHMKANIHNIMEKTQGRCLLIIHPVYERYFKNETARFINLFKSSLTSYISNLGVLSSFEKLWTLNSTLNLPYVLRSSNIFDLKHVFQHKPVIIASAGPSLQDEFDNLRYIKQNQLAYIFAVGSANKSLLHAGIYPDAVCSYDPMPVNYQVLSDIVEQQIDSIPLIFGTPIGRDSVANYPGPILHMVTGQDTLTPYYLEKADLPGTGRILSDAPSIAVVTLELLAKMECSSIILVGQNLAIRGELYYSSGIRYSTRPTETTEAEKNKLLKVQSVNGDEVFTLPEFNVMRKQLEASILNCGIQVINTTRDGAHIEGTQFSRLEDVVSTSLKEPVVLNEWYKSGGSNYDIQSVHGQIVKMQQSYKNLGTVIEDLVKIFGRLDNGVKNKQPAGLNKVFTKFEKCMNKLLKNNFHLVYIKPMLRLSTSVTNLYTIAAEIRAIPNVIDKADKILQVYGKYTFECIELYRGLESYLDHLHTELNQHISVIQSEVTS